MSESIMMLPAKLIRSGVNSLAQEIRLGVGLMA